MSDFENRRILIVDYSQSVHSDFTKLLSRVAEEASGSELASLADDLFGESPAAAQAPSDGGFELTHAMQGREGLEKVERAVAEGAPFAVAFVDVRMPPGWDGIATTEKMIEADPELVVVLCTAFSDYSWEEVVARLGHPDRYLVLKKPFDGIEVQQLASTLTAKWRLRRENQAQVDEIKAYAASLETLNATLTADKLLAESRATDQANFLRNAGGTFGRAAERLRDELERAWESIVGAGRRELDLARRQGHDLAGGLAEMKALAAAETDRRSCRPLEIDLEQLLGEVAAHARRSCALRGLPLEVREDATLPVSAELDRRAVLLSAAALIDWAGERADDRGLTLEAATTRSEALGTYEFQLRVSFHGDAPDATEREDWFRPFQSDEADDLHALALPLCRRIAERHGGRFRLEAGDDGEIVLCLAVDPGPLEPARFRPLRWLRPEQGSDAA
jgi:CheY-like chemotaxis protein